MNDALYSKWPKPTSQDFWVPFSLILCSCPNLTGPFPPYCTDLYLLLLSFRAFFAHVDYHNTLPVVSLLPGLSPASLHPPCRRSCFPEMQIWSHHSPAYFFSLAPQPRDKNQCLKNVPTRALPISNFLIVTCFIHTCVQQSVHPSLHPAYPPTSRCLLSAWHVPGCLLWGARLTVVSRVPAAMGVSEWDRKSV